MDAQTAIKASGYQLGEMLGQGVDASVYALDVPLVAVMTSAAHKAEWYKNIEIFEGEISADTTKIYLVERLTRADEAKILNSRLYSEAREWNGKRLSIALAYMGKNRF